MTLTRRQVFGGAAAALALAAGPLPAIATTRTFDLKVSTFIPGQDVLVDIIRDWADEVTARSDGMIRFSYFPSSQMGPADRQYDMVRKGVADISLFIHGNSPGRFPMTELAYLPGTFGGISCEQGAIVLQGLSEYLVPEHAGTKLLALAPTPEFIVFSAQPFRSFQDLAGRRIRHPGAPMKDALRAVGAVPVGIASPEMGDALQKGLVDGLGINWQAANDWRIDEVGREVLSLPLGAVTFCIVMNEARFRSFPEPIRAMIDETSADMGRRVGQALDRAEAEAEERLRPLCNLTEPEPAEAERFRAILAARRDIWLDRVEARGLPARACYQRLQSAVAQAGGRV